MAATRKSRGARANDWSRVVREFKKADDLGRIKVVRAAIKRDWDEVPDELIDLVEAGVVAARRAVGPDGADRLLDEVYDECPDLACDECVRLAVLRAENAIIAGRSPIEPAREAASSWHSDPESFMRLVDRMRWLDSPELMDVLATALHAEEGDDDEDYEDDEDLDDDQEDGEEPGEDEDDDWDDEDDSLDALFGELDDDTSDRLHVTFFVTMATEALRQGRLEGLRAAASDAGVKDAAALASTLERMAGRPVAEVRAAGAGGDSTCGEDDTMVELAYDFARYLRERHAWPAGRAWLGAERVMDSLLRSRAPELPGEASDLPWWFVDPEVALCLASDLADDGLDHAAAALVLALPLWADFVGATALADEADVAQLHADIDRAIAGHDAGKIVAGVTA